jgi:hypothetical protein
MSHQEPNPHMKKKKRPPAPVTSILLSAPSLRRVGLQVRLRPLAVPDEVLPLLEFRPWGR